MTTTTDIVSVDLVRAAMRQEDRPAGMDEHKVAAAQDRYLKFLRLAAKYPNQPVAPTRDIDYMWHLHMLHPRAYYEDCQRLFGEILDHDAGFGAEPDELPILKQFFDETASLWQHEYGEPYIPEPGAPGMLACWGPRCTKRCRRRV